MPLLVVGEDGALSDEWEENVSDNKKNVVH